MAINPNNFNPFVYDNEDKQNIETSCYTITYNGDFSQPGYKHVIATGQNEYFGTIEKKIELYVAIDDKDTLVSLNSDEFEYTGREIKPIVNVKVNNQQIYENYNDYSAYSVSYQSDIINVGNYQLSVISTNLLGGQIVKRFKIVQANINNIDISYDQEIYGNGTQKWPNIHYIKYNDTELILNVDYEIHNTQSYDNIMPGDSSIDINGLDNYKGIRQIEYKIFCDLNDCEYIQNEFEYTGNTITCNKEHLNLTWFDLGVSLDKFNIEYNNIDYIYPGQKTGIITSNDEFYKNQKEFAYNIICDINRCHFSGYYNSYFATGNEIKPNVIIKLDDYVLQENVDYEIEYDASLDYSTIGNKQFTIKGINGYYGLYTISYIIYDNSSTLVYKKDISEPIIYNNLNNLTRNAINILSNIDDTIIKIQVGSAIQTIENGMFKKCIGLVEADFSRCSAEIPESSFEGCINLITVIMYQQPYITITFNSDNDYQLNIKSLKYNSNTPIVYMPIPVSNKDNYAFIGWYTQPNGKGTLVNAGYQLTNQSLSLYALFKLRHFSVDLDNQWQISTSQPNPDASQYYGVYESYSNYNVNSGWAKMKINITGYTDFTIYIRSYGESSYDYTLAFNLDVEPTSLPSTSTSGVKAHTSRNQKSGTTISDYTKVEYTGIDGGDHFICVVYRKDRSTHSGNDRGYVLIEQPKPKITIKFNIGDGQLISGELESETYQMNTLNKILIPNVIGSNDTPIFACWNSQPNGLGETYTYNSILPNVKELTLYAIYCKNYLCFTAKQDNSTIRLNSDGSNISLLTSVDSINWTPFNVNSTIITLQNINDKIYIKATTNGNESFSDCTFVMTGLIEASGNIQSLLSDDLTRMDVPEMCYSKLFLNCTSLIKPPELPATILSKNCYGYFSDTVHNIGMFKGCTSLIQAPELPATTLADNCYANMFNGCTSLSSAPQLIAQQLMPYCYYHMFKNCTSLIYAPSLQSMHLSYRCYYGMFEGCTSLIQAPELPATTLVDQCYNFMFTGCSALYQAPELPAAKLTHCCYYRLFKDCSSLSSINVSFTNWNDAPHTTDYWVNNVSASGIFICPSELPEEYGSGRVPTGWTIQRK